MRPLGRRLGFWVWPLLCRFGQNRSRSRRGGKVGISRLWRDFQGSVGAGGNLLLVFAGFHAPAFSTALFGCRADQLFSRTGYSAPLREGRSGSRRFHPGVRGSLPCFPPGVLRNRVLSICHHRSPIATVLSLSTTRSVCTVKIQFRSRPAGAPKCRPFLRRRHAELAVEFPDVLLPQKGIGALHAW